MPSCARLNANTLSTHYRLDIKPSAPPKSIARPSKKSFALSDLDVPTIEVTDDFFSRPNSSYEDYDDDHDLDNDDLFLDASTNSRYVQKESPSLKLYRAACKKQQSLPISMIIKGLAEKKISCRFVALSSNDILAICIALTQNIIVNNIEFVQNEISSKGSSMFAEVIENGSYLTHITLSENNIRTEGAKLICDAVRKNEKIKYLDLSGNGFVEKDGAIFEQLIKKSKSLKELYLGKNHLSEEGVVSIANALKVNDRLKVLDLHWNSIRLGGAVAIGKSLSHNGALKKLDLSWNGLYKEGAVSIAESLNDNDTLLELNLTCNRMSEECLSVVMQGLRKNTTLETLRIGKNHLTRIGALTILKQIQANPTLGIKLLDLGNQEVHDTFEELYKEMIKERPIEVKYGMVWKSKKKSQSSEDTDDDEVSLLSCNPLTVLMECMKLQNYRLLDFFKSLDKDRSNLLCIDEMCEGLLRIGIPIREATLLKLLHRIDGDGNNAIDFKEMSHAQELHKKETRRILAANIDYEKTELGRVSFLLRRVMTKHLVMKKEDNDTRLSSSAGKVRKSNSRPQSARVEELNQNMEMSLKQKDM